MKLLVDVGNSRAKWACFDGRTLSGYGSFVHRDAGANTASFEQLLDAHWREFGPPHGVLCCCVAGFTQRETLRCWAAQAWRCGVEFVLSEAEGHGVKNAYAEPHTLGADRWVALVAARALYPGTVCIVDCGTAVTVDVLQKDGVHAGGLILPGLELMRVSLRAGTGEIPLPDAPTQGDFLARSTTHAVVSGTLNAVAGAVERVHARCAKEFGEVRCVLTGGDAQPVMQALKVPAVLEPHLVLRGLGIFACSPS